MAGDEFITNDSGLGLFLRRRRTRKKIITATTTAPAAVAAIIASRLMDFPSLEKDTAADNELELDGKGASTVASWTFVILLRTDSVNVTADGVASVNACVWEIELDKVGAEVGGMFGVGVF